MTLRHEIPPDGCWLTSDQHFGHTNIIKYCNRPFKDADEMTRELISRHNAIVKKDDVVWHLGDFSLNEKRVPEILPKLHGLHMLIMGNHDQCYGSNKKAWAAKRRYFEYGFKVIETEVELGDWTLNHLPFNPAPRADARLNALKPSESGKWLLHGHIHEVRCISGRQINVGVDVWDFAPVHIRELERLRRSL